MIEKLNTDRGLLACNLHTSLDSLGPEILLCLNANPIHYQPHYVLFELYIVMYTTLLFYATTSTLPAITVYIMRLYIDTNPPALTLRATTHSMCIVAVDFSLNFAGEIQEPHTPSPSPFLFFILLKLFSLFCLLHSPSSGTQLSKPGFTHSPPWLVLSLPSFFMNTNHFNIYFSFSFLLKQYLAQ